ncbi:prohibitin family protein [Rhodococcus sp. NPDC004095]
MYESESRSKIKMWTSLGLTAVVVLLGLITLFSSMQSVGTGQVGVVTNYGRVTGRELSEGLSWIAPWGVEDASLYDVKTQKEEQSAAAATSDLQDVSATVVVNYHIERGKVSNIHRSVGVNYKDVLVTPAIQEVFKASSAKYTAVELQQNRDKVKSDVVVGLKKRLSDRGIVIEDVSITNLQYSPEFTKAIEQRQVAQQNAERAQYNLQQAQLDAQSQQVQAETLTDNYLHLKEIENQNKAIDKWNGQLPTTTAGDNGGLLFNIPASK